MSDKSKAKYLVDTSCVPLVLGESTAAHVETFNSATQGGNLFSSVYIRKEFIKGWIASYLNLACCVNHFDSVDQALFHLEQEFSIRDVKRIVHALGVMLREKGVVNNVAEAAVEILRVAVVKMKKYDARMKSRIDNKCGCLIGAKSLAVNYDDWVKSVEEFTASVGPVEDCPLNDFLQIESATGKAGAFCEDDGVAKTRAGGNLKKIVVSGQRIGCKKCATIGDAVIALEQPPSWRLLTLDNDFSALCNKTKRGYTILPSERAVERDRTSSEDEE